MTREEIREEGIHRFYRMLEDNLPLGETLDGYLAYLHENDVVIKVDREIDRLRCSKDTLNYLTIELGLVAVEPLIKEERDAAS